MSTSLVKTGMSSAWIGLRYFEGSPSWKNTIPLEIVLSTINGRISASLHSSSNRGALPWTISQESSLPIRTEQICIDPTQVTSVVVQTIEQHPDSKSGKVTEISSDLHIPVRPLSGKQVPGALLLSIVRMGERFFRAEFIRPSTPPVQPPFPPLP